MFEVNKESFGSFVAEQRKAKGYTQRGTGGATLCVGQGGQQVGAGTQYAGYFSADSAGRNIGGIRDGAVRGKENGNDGGTKTRGSRAFG